jgi:hypothetical protein
MKHPPRVIQVIRVTRGHDLPGIAGGVSCRKTERLQEPLLAIGAMVGQRLAGPLAGDQHPPPGVAEVIGVVGLALAPAGNQAGPHVLGLDTVAEPVRAGRRARLEPQRLSQPGRMRLLSVGLGAVAVTDPDAVYQAAADLLDDTHAYSAMAQAVNPFGDGHAAARIVSRLAADLAAHSVCGGTPPPSMALGVSSANGLGHH